VYKMVGVAVFTVRPDAKHDSISSVVAIIDDRVHYGTAKQEVETKKVTNQQRAPFPGQKERSSKTDIPSH
jgi:hypothetical protein